MRKFGTPYCPEGNYFREVPRPPGAAPKNLNRKLNMSMRTHYCGLTTEALLGQTVSLCGWVHRRRDHGGVIFIDLRDREGLVQVVCDPDRADTFKAAEAVRNEFCLRITGVVRNRPEGTTNANLASGKIEVLCQELEVLNPSVTPPEAT